MRRDPRLRAFVRYTSKGDIVPMSMVIRKQQPKGRGWVEIDSNICCLPVVTTTTT